MRNTKTFFIVEAAIIAALYIVLTYLADTLGLASHAIQVRFSEALTILPFFTPAAIPGLYVGCLLSNIIFGCALPDIIFGSLATLVGAIGTYYIAHGTKKPTDPRFITANKIKQFLCTLPPVIANVIVVPPILLYVYQLEGTLPFFMLTVGIGEIISCILLGLILLNCLFPYKNKIFIK
ncbi:MAG: QueT transporter family protein [Butyrivibrio sp.]|nr:QueT transporter family protein [Butyrivibrio sp.]